MEAEPGSQGDLPAEELLVRAAAGLNTEEREAFLRLCCVGDPSLRAVIDERLSERLSAGEVTAAGAVPEETACPRAGGASGGAAAPAEDPDYPRFKVPVEEEGSTIGPYRLLERVGEGGMGEVYRAEQSVPLRRTVAFKLLKLGLNTRLVVARFEAERQALALMDHPGIARVFDAGSTPLGRPYFAMEYVDGVPLTTYCDSERLPLRARLKLFVEICRAVQHAHQKGIIHRDLKPSNILVADAGGEGPAVKVIDFGIAKATGGRLTDQTIATGYLQLLGTPAYMSPEQIGGAAADVDTRCDIYALGGVLYELLTGTTPVDPTELARLSPAELERVLRQEDAEPPSARVKNLGPVGAAVACYHGPGGARRLETALRGDLDWIALKALEKDRERRYATADQLAADVERHLRNEPVEAGPPTARYRLGKFVRRHRTPLAMGAVAVAALVAGLAATTWQAYRAIVAGEEAADARGRGEDLIEFMLRDLIARLQPIGRVELLEAVGEEVLDYYEDFDPTGEPLKFLLAQSEALMRVAKVKETRGKPGEAIAAVRRAQRIVRQLEAAHEGEARERYRHLAAVYLAEQANLRRVRGDPAGADADFAAAAATFRSTAAADSTVTRRVDRVTALNNWAVVRYSQGDTDRGRAALAEAREIIEGLKGEGVHRPEVENQDGINLANTAAVLRLAGDLDRAKELYLESAQIWRRRLGADPDNVIDRNALASTLEHLLSIQLEKGDLPGAIESQRASARERERLAALDPENADWQHNLAENHLLHGRILNLEGNLGPAREAYSKAGELWENLLDRDPSNALARESRAQCDYETGVIAFHQADAGAARFHFERSADEFGKLIGKRSTVQSRWWSQHAFSQAGLAQLSASLGDPDTGVAAVEAAIEVHEQLVGLDPGDTSARFDLAVTHRLLAELHMNRNDIPAAQAAFADSIRIHEQLVLADPTHAGWTRSLADACINAGEVERAAGNMEGAVQFRRRALGAAKSLARANPGIARNELLLAVTYSEMASALKGVGDIEAAITHARASLDAAGRAKRLGLVDPDIDGLSMTLLQNLGHYHAERGDLARARDLFERALKALQALKPPPGETVPRPTGLRIAMVHTNLGFLEKRDGNAGLAAGHFAEALRIRQRHFEDQADDRELAYWLLNDYHNVGVSLWEAGDVEGAIAHYLGAIDLEPSTGSVGEWPEGRMDLAQLHWQLASRHRQEGEHDLAWEAMLASVGWRAALLDTNPGSNRYQRELAGAYRSLAHHGLEQGRTAEAQTARHVAVALLQPLAAAAEPGAEDELLVVAGELRWGSSGAPLSPLVAAGSTWRYHSSAGGPGPGWAAPGFDDSGWPEGRAQLGFGDGDEATVIPFGPDPKNKHLTAYFRRRFSAPTPPGGIAGDWLVRLLCDDGAAVYFNGEEVGRINLPSGELTPDTRASEPVSGRRENRFVALPLPAGLLRVGENTLAVEVHQGGPTSSDLGFDLELIPDPRPPGGLQPPRPERLASDAHRLSIPLPAILEPVEAGPGGGIAAE